MKRIKIISIVSVAVIALTALVLIACNKEEQILPNTTGISSNMPFKQSAKPPTTVGCHTDRTSKAYDEDHNSICDEDGVDCLKCVIVVGSAPVQQMIENITNLIGQSGDNVATFFSDAANFADLLPELGNKDGKTFLELLLSGDYVIEDVVVSANGNGVILFHREATVSFAAAPTSTSSQTYGIPFSITDKNE
jgi:hypothetical protein